MGLYGPTSAAMYIKVFRLAWVNTKEQQIAAEYLTFSIQAVHHCCDNVQFHLDGEVDEVGVNEDVERRSKLRVVGKEHGRRSLSPEDKSNVYFMYD